MAGAAHLAKRFFGSLRPGRPDAADEEWVRSQLGAGEVDIWQRLSNPDRRHAVGVARRVDTALGEDATRPVVAAALLHDSGKLASGLGTFRRVGATLVTPGPDWLQRSGWRRRVALYRDHGRLGAELLAAADSDPLTVAWAREHHLPADQWTVDPRIAEALKAADDD